MQLLVIPAQAGICRYIHKYCEFSIDLPRRCLCSREEAVEEIPVEKQAAVSFVAQKNSAFRAGSPAEPLPGAVRPRNAKFLQKITARPEGPTDRFVLSALRAFLLIVLVNRWLAPPAKDLSARPGLKRTGLINPLLPIA